MRFPETPRVVYARNPLDQVICQVRFARVLRIEADLPVAFQERFKTNYPSLKETQNFRLPPGVARAMEVDPQVGAQRSFQFTDSDNAWSVTLSSDFVSLMTRKYTRWEDFRARLFPILDAIETLYEVQEFTRVGLRYRDIIWRSETGFTDATPWSKLLRPEILGELNHPEVAMSVHEARRLLVLGLDLEDACVRLQHHLVERDKDDDVIEDGYLIDADFFTETEKGRSDAEKYLQAFNQESGRLFRWCITDELHRALEPRDP